jgi:cytochrome P450
MGFGHGNHACPGRFFAASELKIQLSHLLIKYEWKLAQDDQVQALTFGFATPSDPKAKISIRRRQQPEIEL